MGTNAISILQFSLCGSAGTKLVVCSGGDDQSLCWAEMLLPDAQNASLQSLEGIHIHKEREGSGSALKGVKLFIPSARGDAHSAQNTVTVYTVSVGYDQRLSLWKRDVSLMSVGRAEAAAAGGAGGAGGADLRFGVSTDNGCGDNGAKKTVSQAISAVTQQLQWVSGSHTAVSDVCGLDVVESSSSGASPPTIGFGFRCAVTGNGLQIFDIRVPIN